MAYHPENFTVWAEIPVRDLETAMAFYAAVLETDMMIEDMGPNAVAVFKPAQPGVGVAGHLYPGNPAPRGCGPTVHLNAPGKLEDTMDRVRAAGGTVIAGPIAIPAGRFTYCEDLDGNSFGVMERA